MAGPELTQDQAPPSVQPQPQPQATQNPGAVSVQARIRARREQRRAQAIQDAYSHLYETYIGMGYLRFAQKIFKRLHVLMIGRAFVHRQS